MALREYLDWLAVATTRNPHWDTLFMALLLVAEAVLCTAIVQLVPYTEIDWTAYMQQVTTFQQGERDYIHIRGVTGPLVYPAGFLYLYTALQRVCDALSKTWLSTIDAAEDPDAVRIRMAQYLFVLLYLANQWLVWCGVYQPAIATLRERAAKPTASSSFSSVAAWQIWSWRCASICTCLSKRVHSIFVLRLFNDGPTMLLFYGALYLFTRQYWNVGCIVFSLAVSVKMNVLLFAPGLLLLLLQVSDGLAHVVYRLLLYCALPQLILGAPFLLTHPIHYLRKAFELDRVFFYKWTVNWKVRPIRSLGRPVNASEACSKGLSFSCLCSI
jgi:alpha-1,3-mannosyltransferase